jgi:microcystin-dependent protein
MSDMYYLGQICLFPYNFAPAGFYECNGIPLKVNEHTALYSLLGDKFGGNGETFNLPRMEAPHGMIYCICFAGNYPPRN